MLSVYVPRGTSLERVAVEPGDSAAGGRGVDRPGHAHRAGGQGRRPPARHRAADARGDAGDRGLQPALCRERRALHDRDADVPLRQPDAEVDAGHLHPHRPPARHRALRRAAPLRHRRAQAGAHLPAADHRRDRADGPARRHHRPRRRHPRAHRRRDRPDLAHHLRAGRGRRPAVLQRRAQGARPQGRPDLEGAREPGLGRPAAVVPRQRVRRPEVAEGDAPAIAVDAARRASRSPTTPATSPTR